MPMPTTSPGPASAGSNRSRVSSMSRGSPYASGVAEASTYSQRGVMTPMPNETGLGFTRKTVIGSGRSRDELRQGKYCASGSSGGGHGHNEEPAELRDAQD